MKNHFQKIGKGLGGYSQRLYKDMVQGLKSFSENPGKHAIQLGKDYWDLSASILIGYAGIKIATRTGVSSPLYTDPAWLATQVVWYGSVFSPYVFKPEKTTLGNHARALRNLFGGVIPNLYFAYPPPWDWLLSSGFGGIGGVFSESFRHWEKTKASKTSEPKKPKNLENTINQNS